MHVQRTARLPRGPAGLTLLELMFSLGIVTTILAIALPLGGQAIDSLRTAAATRYLAGRIHLARLEAVKRSASVALRFEPTDDDYRFTTYVDGNQNGIRTADITRGIDVPLTTGERLYYGVLAPRAAWRAVLVPATSHAIAVSDSGLSVEGEGEANHAGASRSGAYQWAELMRRTFGLDVLACTRCGGRLRLVALIEQASVVQRILRHLGLPTEVPEPRPARSPPRPFDATDDQFLDVPECDAAW